MRFVSTYTGKRLSGGTHKSRIKSAAKYPRGRVSFVVKYYTFRTKVTKMKVLKEM